MKFREKNLLNYFKILIIKDFFIQLLTEKENWYSIKEPLQIFLEYLDF